MTNENFNIDKERVGFKLLPILCCLLFQSISVLAQNIDTLMSQAEELEYEGLFQEALELRSQIKILCEQKKDWDNAVINHCNIGYSCWELKEHTLMKIHLDSALTIAQNQSLDEFGEAYATIWNYLGFYNDETGQYQKAIRNYQEAIRIDEKLVNSKIVEETYLGDGYYNLGAIFTKMGDYDLANNFYEKAITYYANNNCSLVDLFNAIAVNTQD
ncbi:MAG: tetratricopeptide repeat protein, partial [Bacteroidota bacterium]